MARGALRSRLGNQSRVRPGSIGWWAISGDLPTDYVTAADLEPPGAPEKGHWSSLRIVG